MFHLPYCSTNHSFSRKYYQHTVSRESIINTRIQYRITAMVSRCVLGCVPSYLRDLCCPVSVLAARRVLRSAARGEFLVPRARLAIMQRRAFSVVGPSAWNDLP